MNHIISIVSIIVLLFSQCGQRGKDPVSDLDPGKIKEPMIIANQDKIKKESKEIDQYIERKGLSMKETGTGLRYVILKEGQGPNARNGQYAKVNFKVSLLDGTLCYSSDSTGSQEFLIGQDNVESGLHEGILLMNVGSKAKFIMPPHLAHGLMGDDDKIPANSTIVYDIELLRLR